MSKFIEIIEDKQILIDKSDLNFIHKQISDLETKLAESESKANDWKQRFESSEERFKTFNSNGVTALNLKNKKIDQLKQQLTESEEQVKHWHDLYNERDKQFQSVRQRYHLLNKLQSNYDKKDKLHLAYMQCAELVDENEQLKQQLAEKETRIAELEDKDWYEDTIKQLEEQNGKLIEERDNVKFQLAEKDVDLSLARNEIDTLKHNLNISQNHDNVMCEQYFEKCKEINQDKISFCIERLEKVKERIKNSYHYGMYNQYLENFIKNQINELKEKKYE